MSTPKTRKNQNQSTIQEFPGEILPFSMRSQLDLDRFPTNIVRFPPDPMEI